MKQPIVVSVSSVLMRIKTLLQNGLQMDDIWIQGEISNLTKHRSGHYYFSLKDAKGEMSCVMFSSFVKRVPFDIQTGMKVLVKASVNVYEQRGSLQLYVKEMKQDGIGDLYLEFEQRKKQLLELGYFAIEHKLKKPEWIQSIGVITAKEGAALQDVLSTIQKRWPMLDVTLYPAYVQGNFASASLIRQLKKADQKGHDALLIVRGGGSFEDLFCFNDVSLIQTIYDLTTYTVSGVGHEVDTTLCDLVCDQRCVTPTAAAQWVTLDQYQIREQIHQQEQYCVQNIHRFVQNQIRHFQQISKHPYIQDPFTFLIDKRLKLDGLSQEIEHKKVMIFKDQEKIKSHLNNIELKLQYYLANQTHQFELISQNLYQQSIQYIETNRYHLHELALKLDAYSPLKVLHRGYSITKHQQNIIHSIHDVQKDDIVSIQVKDGLMKAQIIDKEEFSWKKKH